MRPIVRASYTAAVEARVLERIGLARADLTPLGSYEGFVYALLRAGRALVLRVGHTSRRSTLGVWGEVDFVRHVANRGVRVARPVPHTDGRFVATVPDDRGEEFHAVLFERAPGAHLDARAITPAVARNWGRMLAQLHVAARDYIPGDPTWLRPTWDSPSNIDTLGMLNNEHQPAAEHDRVTRLYRETVARIHSLPSGPEHEGLIHLDAHAGNFFVDEHGALTLFDFDDCVHGRFVHDIGIVLFYLLVNRPDAAEFGARFWTDFELGYREHATFHNWWYDALPLFTKLRELEMWAIVHHDGHVAEAPPDSWIGRFMFGRAERLAAGEPAVGFHPAPRATRRGD